MQNVQYTIQINAPREKVWNTMLSDEGYRAWSAPFSPAGSSYRGSWDKGSRIEFFGVNPETGKEECGAVGEIAENRLHEFVSIKHLGGIDAPLETEAFENYTLREVDGGTEVLVEITYIPDEWVDMMNESWPKALETLKEIAER